MCVLQVPPAVSVEGAGRSELGLLDDDQLTAVRHGFEVPQAAFFVGMAEVASQSGMLIERSVVRHGLCLDAREINHTGIVPAGVLQLYSFDITS